jgi:hypothetical protein
MLDACEAPRNIAPHLETAIQEIKRALSNHEDEKSG